MLTQGLATKIIILINCLVAAASVGLSLAGQPDYIHTWLTMSVGSLLAGAWWEPLTSMWVHAPFFGWGVLHLVFNMTTLAGVGKVAARESGVPRYLVLYFSTGLVAALFFIIEALVRAHGFGDTAMLDVPVMGASGAVCGVLGAFAVFSPDTKLYVMLVPVAIRARTAVWGLIAISAALLVTSSAGIIAHSAHIGGLLAGLWCGHRWRRPAPPPW
jgi:membrane associated rhomboid family serine protease